MSRRIVHPTPERRRLRGGAQPAVYSEHPRRWPGRLLLVMVVGILLVVVVESGALGSLSLPHPGSATPKHPPSHPIALLALPRPVALTPRNGTHLHGGVARLCWSPVHAASGYDLQITGLPTVIVDRTCKRVTLYPGFYTWSVAAFSRRRHSAGLRYSTIARFTMLPRPASSHRGQSVAHQKQPQQRHVPAPVQHPVSVAPATQAPLQPAPVQQAPVQQAPVVPAPVQRAPVSQTPVQQAPAQQAPVKPTAPAQQPVRSPQNHSAQTPVHKSGSSKGTGASGCIPMYTC